MNIQEVIWDVTVDQPLMGPKKILSESDKPTIESSYLEEISSNSDNEESAHAKMDLDLEDDNPNGE